MTFGRKGITMRYIKKKPVYVLMLLVIFFTTYSLIVPAASMTRQEAEEDPGITLNEYSETDSEEENSEPEKITQKETISEETKDPEELDETADVQEPEDPVDEEQETAEEPAETAENTETLPEPEETEIPEITAAEEETEPSPVLSYPAVSFEETIENFVTVKAEAEEGTFPEGTTMVLTPVEQEEVIDTVKETVEGNVKHIVAVDITFKDVNGNEIEPLKQISVTMSASSIKEETETEVVHIDSDGNGTLVEQEESAEDEVIFNTDSFSVYVIAYTVDFHWEVDGKTYDFSIPGGGFVSFEKLMEVLDVVKKSESEEKDGNSAEIQDAEDEPDQEAEVTDALEQYRLTLDDVQVSQETKIFVKDVDKMEFSNPELLSVSKVQENTTVGAIKDGLELECQYSADLTEEDIEKINSTEVESGDWALISLLPFNTTETLTVTMKTGEAFTVKVTDAAVENGANTKIPRDNINVNNREEGIILKLFDYSGTATNNNGQTRDIDAIHGNATTYARLRSGTGVNNGRTLLFSGSGLGGSEPYNNFTGERPSGMEYYSGKRYSGTVKNELVGGYPQLSDNITKYGSDDGNLDYLFKGGEQAGVTEYSANGQGLQGLLRKDADGYYYYSSEDNYARFDGNDYIDLYTDTYFKKDGQAAHNNNGYGSIGFFPFTDYNSSKKEEKGPNEMYYNHQLGMSLQAYFTYPPNGKLDDGEGAPTSFEFSGDDDVWVYVDGKLAMDLGGVHQPIRGIIDFAKQEVRIYEYNAYNSSNSPKTEYVTTISFNTIFGQNGFDDTPYSTHKLDFFFLERGGCDSNCALSFNLQTLTTAEKEFTKADGEDAGLPGATFTIYTDEACTHPVSVSNQALTATSDNNGKVSFATIPVRKDSDDTPVVYYMKETAVPEGYHTNNNTYKLVYNTTTKTYDVLTLENESSETIVNTLLHPIELGVQKQWQDAAGNAISPVPSDYSASFVVQRKESHVSPSIPGETTVRIGYVDDSNNGWKTSIIDSYSFKRTTDFTIHYRYKDSYNSKMQMHQPQNSSNQYPEYGRREGTFTYTVPNNGTYDIYFYNRGGGDDAVSWTLTGEEVWSESEATEFEDDDDFNEAAEYQLNLSNGVTSGTFVGPLGGKFPVQEEINGTKYRYKYYIKETGKSPSNTETIYVDSSGRIISDTSAEATDDDYTQTVINRELMDIPIEKFWEFDKDDVADAWTATFQLESRLVDKATGEAVTSFEPVEEKKVEVTSQNSGTGVFSGLPMFTVVDGTEYRVVYSVSEIAYRAWRTSDNTTVLQWQDPEYYDNPVTQIGNKYSLHFVQDAGENGASLDDYSLIDINTPENRVETKQIGISIEKAWPDGVDLANAHADFVLKRGVYEEYRNFPAGTNEWVDITLVTGSTTQTLTVAKDWTMTIFGNVKANTNAENIEFSDGSTPSGVPVYSYDNSSENKEHLFYIQFTADQSKTITLVDGAQYVVGGNNGFRLTDINNPGDMVIREDSSFELPFTLSSENDWSAYFHHLSVIEEDTQYDVDHPLEITRYVYRYYFEETGCSPDGYAATFKDSSGQLLGDKDNRIDNESEITAENHLKPGSLKITKNVTVNSNNPSALEAALVDGTYEFTITGVTGTPTENEQPRTVQVDISNGQSTTVEVKGLIPGQYTVTEVAPENGTSLVGSNNILVTVESDKTGELVPDGAKASFTNNIDTVDITFGKDWKQKDKTTDLTGKEDVLVTYTLMQIAVNGTGKPVHNDIYEGTYFLSDTMRTATADYPCIFYVSQNTPVTVTDLPKEGVFNGEPVTYKYYAVETEVDGFIPDAQPAISQGTYTITNSAAPETSKTTNITVEKNWSGDNAEQIGGVKFKLIQEKAEIPASSFYPFVIHLQDQDGEIRQPDVVKYVKHNTSLDIPVISNGSLKGSVWMGITMRLNGQSFQVTSITSDRSVLLRLFSLTGAAKEWGTDWNLGQITVYNGRGEVSDTPATFINQLNSNASTELDYSDTGVEYIVNMPQKGSSELVGHDHGTTDYPGEWKTTVNNLPYYDRGEDGKYYAYRYRVVEVSIIDPETKEVIEAVTQNADGTGGESVHFTVAYNNSTDGQADTPLEITNTRKAETNVTLKKVDVADLDNTDLTDNDLLNGAKFKIEKYKKLNPLEKDNSWNNADNHSAENAGNGGTFTFTGLTPGIYMIFETEYPEGYIKMTSDHVFRVNEDLSIDLLDPAGNPVDGNRTDTARVVENSVTIIVGNTPGAALPSTGGPGTKMFYLSGILMMLGAGYLLSKRTHLH